MQISRMPDLVYVNRAIISVTDKTDLKYLVSGLYEINPNIEIISTGGTAAKIREDGFPVTQVSDYTGVPESPDGLLKTLNQKIHGGWLQNPDEERWQIYTAKQGIKPIELVVVNLYEFVKKVAEGVSLRDLIDHGIDIGGPSMIRGAAKKFERTAALMNPQDYAAFLGALRENNGYTTFQQRYELAKKVFITTAAYDKAIAGWFASDPLKGQFEIK
jgi:phosphoribosylaminoimidazolecarboxamide formyltransferase / IMP cyclohydrolase